MRFKIAAAAAFILGTVIAISPKVSSNDIRSWESKIGPSLRLSHSFVENRADVIVIMEEQANLFNFRTTLSKADKGRNVVQSLRTVAVRSQKDLANLLQDKGVKFRQYYIMNAIAAFDLSPDMIKEIASRPDVRKIILNPVLTNHITAPSVSKESLNVEGPGQNIVSTGAAAVWEKFNVRGEGIVVAGQDTGVAWTHPALQKHYRGMQDKNSAGAKHDYNWHDAIHEPTAGVLRRNSCGYNLKVPCDDDQHGTHTMGTMVGDDGGQNKVGMAPEAKWVACRNMDSGVGRPSTYIECFEWFLAPYKFGQTALQGDPEMAPHVINNSWGCPASEGCEGREMIPVLQALKEAGIMVVVSAGNEGAGCGSIGDQPATISDLTFSVGAHNHRNGQIASFSSRGPSVIDKKIGPDITAPGVSVRSTVPGGGYEEAMWSGTSMAGPHVAGAVALLWSAQPKLIGRIDETAQILTATATRMTSSQSCGGTPGTNIPNNTYGYGHLNILKAVEAALSL